MYGDKFSANMYGGLQKEKQSVSYTAIYANWIDKL